LPDIEDHYFSWAQGYMAGMNATTVGPYNSYKNLAAISTKAQEAFIRNYCDQHPLGNYLDAVQALLSSLPTNKMPSAPASAQ
jgi:hypothetical protein